MKLITKQTDYAIRILSSMARDSGNIQTTTILAEKLKISKSFVRSILQKLNKESIVVSTKGKGGGFKLAVDLDNVFVASIIKIFDGPVKFDNCLVRNNICPDALTCPLKKKLKEISNYINEEFGTLTLGSLLKQ